METNVQQHPNLSSKLQLPILNFRIQYFKPFLKINQSNKQTTQKTFKSDLLLGPLPAAVTTALKLVSTLLYTYI